MLTFVKLPKVYLFPIPYSLFPVPCSLFPQQVAKFPLPQARC
ncbi:hypothetical protein [Moorena bouillonii]|nr:hypothetical protein [Moorena bouillonii]